MLLLNQNNLGEQALNKIAEMALYSQFNDAKQLRVKVKTDPNLLAQGKLASLSIDGEGLVSHKNLRMQQMQLQMRDIAVSPFKALMGNIELIEPTRGTACVVLTKADFNRAFNTQCLSDRASLLGVKLESVHCHLLDSGKLQIEASLHHRSAGESPTVTLEAKPKITPQTGEVTLTQVEYTQGKPPSSELTDILVNKAREVLSLRNFEMRGISLRVQSLEVRGGSLRLHAIAKMTHFPSK
ncbi:DUF2993 domain-containing protein [Spirulina sp. CS-785/01]|uniref:LmeA family phospholipid-binding protein n=1 Tax=Spirulina sp. CS-785/01 TaxID=3021716 RepID=UPI00232BDBDD|nr:DUF2993 domain-containing protein [Spirulina sp. CS-785/01]MDB9315196.1 DUF2993 domain-containing protein [Spirulina sp. CS-785/01]